MPFNKRIPVVLCLSGHDPSGGAGIQADIESIAAQGCHAASIITCLTLQDSKNVLELRPLPVAFIMQQAKLVTADFHIAAIKIGLLGTSGIVEGITELLTEFRSNGLDTPVVLDPVLTAGGGANLATTPLIPALLKMLPLVTLLTPNRQEVRRLWGMDSVNEAAEQCLSAGCNAVLVTGADESEGQQVVNQLYQQDANKQWRTAKLDGQYHGSGCTLAASIAARLALGESLSTSITKAQDYTLTTLLHASQPGHGQAIPRRIIPCTD